jgi:hypothetical protein
MVSTTVTVASADLRCISWASNAYDEAHWKRGEEPRRRRLRVVAHSSHSQWHITITFTGSLHPDRIAQANRKKRRQDFEELCSCLDFESAALRQYRHREGCQPVQGVEPVNSFIFSVRGSGGHCTGNQNDSINAASAIYAMSDD